MHLLTLMSITNVALLELVHFDTLRNFFRRLLLADIYFAGAETILKNHYVGYKNKTRVFQHLPMVTRIGNTKPYSSSTQSYKY